MAFIRIYLKDTLKRQVELGASRLTIGRSKDNDIVIDDPGVSSHHAELVKADSGYEIIDSGSTNGIYVNGKRVQRQKLRYWDEVQVFNHVLKFMAVAGLESERELRVSDKAPADATMEVDVSNLDDLVRLRRRKKEVYLNLTDKDGEMRKLPLKKVNFTIGKGRNCDLRLTRLFAPRVAATIRHHNDGFYLVPGRWGRVRLNTVKVLGEVKLKDTHWVRVCGLDFTFCNRVLEE